MDRCSSLKQDIRYVWVSYWRYCPVKQYVSADWADVNQELSMEILFMSVSMVRDSANPLVVGTVGCTHQSDTNGQFMSENDFCSRSIDMFMAWLPRQKCQKNGESCFTPEIRLWRHASPWRHTDCDVTSMRSLTRQQLVNKSVSKANCTNLKRQLLLVAT